MSTESFDIGAAFDEAYGASPELEEMAKPSKRRAAEKRVAMRPDDGRRRKQAAGRTEQFNIKVKPALKAKVIAASRAHNLPITDLAEQAFEMMLKQLDDKRSK